MADQFDVDAYFAALSNQDNPYAPPSRGEFASKRQKVAEAQQRKVQALQATQAQYQRNLNDSLLGQVVQDFGIDPEGYAGTAVNASAELLNGLSRLAGWGVAAPLEAVAAIQEFNTPEAARQAWSREQQGFGQPMDTGHGITPIADPQMDAVRAAENAQAAQDKTLLDQPQNLGTNNREVLDNARTLREASGKVRNFFDLSGLVWNESRNNLTSDLAAGGSKENLKTLGKAWDKLSDGEVVQGLREGVPAAADLMVNAIKAGINNPDGVRSYLTENIPQLAVSATGKLAMTAMNGSYALDTFSQGIENYAKQNDGALPPEDQLYSMAGHALAAGAAELVGDASILGMFGKAGTKAGADTLLASAGRGVGATIKGTGSEAATEGFQTYAEGVATNKPATAMDIYQGAAIGGLVGGAMTSGAQAVSEAARQGEKIGIRTTEESGVTTAQKTALQSMGELFKATRDGKDDPLKQADNLAQADAVIGNLEARRGQLQKVLDSTLSDEEVKASQAQLTGLQEMLANTDPQDQQTRADLTESIDLVKATLDDHRKTAGDATKQRKEVAALDKSLSVAREQRARMEALVRPSSEQMDGLLQQVSAPEGEVAPEARQQATDQVITLAMRSPGAFSDTQLSELADNETNGLSTPQRQYLRMLSSSRQAENQAKGLQGVNQDVLLGNRKQGYLGISDYRSGFRQAVSSGDPAAARTQIDGLRTFAQVHSVKARQAVQAYRQARSSGESLQMTSAGNGQWEIAPLTLSREELRANGGLEIGARSGPLVDGIVAEAQALRAASRELQAGFDVVFAPAAASVPDQPVPAAGAVPAQEIPATQAPAAGIEPVPVATPAVEQSVQAPVAEAPAPLVPEAVPGEMAAVLDQSPVESTPVEEQPVGDAPAETRKGTLSLFQRDSGLDYRTGNRTAQQFEQRAGRANAATLRPLASVGDFLGALREGRAILEDFLGFAPDDKQLGVIGKFRELAGDWRQEIQANLFQRPANQREHNYKDPIQDFLDENGLIDENLATAISYAAFSWVAENASKPSNTADEINAILGRDDDAYVTPAMVAALGHVGSREKLAVLSFGQRVMEALGLQPKANAFVNEQSRLEQALGAQVMALLVQQKLVQRSEVSQATLDRFTLTKEAQAQRPAKEWEEVGKRRVYFLRIAREPGTREASKLATSIYKSSVGTQGVLGKLFGTEDGMIEPSFEPIPFTQQFAKRTNQEVPQELAMALEKVQSTPFFVRQDNWKLWQKLDRQTLLELAGGVGVDGKQLHKEHRASTIAKNDDLLRQIENFDDFVHQLTSDSEDDIGFGMYFETSVWKPQRVGFKTNLVNPQTSKVHRHMLYMKDWETEITVDDEASMEGFKLQVAEGLGIKTDKMANLESLEKLQGLLADPVIRAGVSALRKGLYGEGELTSAEQDRIRLAVAKGGENFHSFDALVGLVHYAQAKATGQKTFTVQMMGEVDGVTNGPMLSLFAMGAASFQTLNRGGFYSLTDGTRNYNLWRGQGGNLDLYEATIAKVNEGLQRMVEQSPNLRSMLEGIYRLTGKPYNDSDGKVTSDGRKMIKTPLTAMVFGSGIDNAISNMADEFVDKFYVNLEKLANGGDPTKLRPLLETVNLLLAQAKHKSAKLDTAMTLEQAMEFSLSPQQVAALRNVFVNTVGVSVADTLRGNFAVFIERRHVFNQTAQAAFGLFDGAYRHYRDKARKGIETVIRDKQPTPIHDITRQQDQDIRNQLSKLAPVLHTAMSRASDNLASGLYLTKRGTSLTDDLAYSIETKFGRELALTGMDGKPSAFSTGRFSGIARGDESPGVSPMILDTHSLDSATAVGVYGKMDVLNLHDAGGTGVGRMQEMARAYNASLYDRLIGYSGPLEIQEVWERSIVGALDLLARDNSPGLRESMAAALQSVMTRMGKEVVEEYVNSGLGPAEFVLQRVTRMAYDAQWAKLDNAANLAIVDQYAFEGGAYEVTEEQRQEARRLQAELSPQVRESMRLQAAELDALLPGRPVEASTELQEDQAVPIQAPASVPQVTAVAAAARAPNVLTEVQARVVEVQQQMLEHNQALETAANEVLAPREAAYVLQAVTEQAREAVNHWGELGTPLFEVDAELEQALAAQPEMPVGRVMGLLKGRLTGANAELLKAVAKVIDRNLTVRYVTPATDPTVSASQGVTGFRGWYEVRNGQGQIFVKGAQFRHAGINAELLLHELVHASIAGVIQRGQDGSSPQVWELVRNLEEIRRKAAAYVNEQGLGNQFGPAVANVDELVAWGMTNQDFQEQVLKRITLNQSTAKNSLITGVNAFIRTLIDLLFAGSGLSPQKVHKTGMALLVKNVSGLYKEASLRPAVGVRTLAMASPSAQAATAALELGTVEIFEALEQYGQTVLNGTRRERLLGLLDGIVTELHGPFGSFKVQRQQNQALTPTDVYLKTLYTGQLPFASASLASGLPFSEAEAYVLEQVEATVKAALEQENGVSSVAYRRLQELFREARQQVKPEDFYAGDWFLASPVAKQTAQGQWDFVFKASAGSKGRSDYLARFVALGLVYEPLQAKMGQLTAEVAVRDWAAMGWFEKLRSLFEDLLDGLGNKLANVSAGERQDIRLGNLVDQLVDIEAKRRYALMQRSQGTLADRFDSLLESASKEVRSHLETLGKTKFFRESSQGIIRVMGKLPGAAAPARLNYLMDGLQRLRDAHFPGRLGVVAGLVNETRGASEATQYAYTLSRVTKQLEQQRKGIIGDVSKLIAESYANEGEDLTREHKTALSKVLLRTDLQALLDGYGIEGIARLINDPQELEKTLAEHIARVRKLGQMGRYYIRQVKDLAYYKATGLVVGPHVMSNTLNIASLAGTPRAGKLSQAEVELAVPALDSLQALLALSYTDMAYRAMAGQVLNSELARGNENGALLTLLTHRELQKQSAQRLFGGSEALRLQGFVPEIFNPNTDLQVAGGQVADQLVASGYVRLEHPVHVDPADPDQALRYVHVLKHGGTQAYQSGVISFTGDKTRGRELHSGVNSFLTEQPSKYRTRLNGRVARQRAQEIAALFAASEAYHPGKSTQRRMLPVVNAQGQVVNYRYMMSEENKDRLLERTDTMDQVLGVMAGNLFDKESGREQNDRTVEALHEQYLKEYAERPEAYVEVSPTSPDSEAREAWIMLPQQTKEKIRAVWGEDLMLVRSDLLDLVFGYRKPSLSSAFDKDPELRSTWENLVVMFGEAVFGEKAAVRIRQGEGIVETLVGEAKDIIVVKSGLTLLGNMQSNLTQLLWEGVSPADVLKHHRIALQGALAYRRDTHELVKLQSMLDAGYLVGGVDELRQRVVELRDALARNPVGKLIEEGLLPSIVEDVSVEDDPYSYRGQALAYLEKKTRNLPGFVKDLGKTLYVAHDTPLYRLLGQGTQLSDFMARYTLYQHLVGRSNQPMAHEQAVETVSDAFINYDIPSHRVIQYLNDKGILMFTKYYIRIQKVLLRMFRENPAKALMLGTLEGYFSSMQSVMDGHVFNQFGNPLNGSVLKYPESLDELVTLKVGMGLFSE